ncbi:MAG: hypothetical protein VYB44_00425 [Bacteroidota bacterium]|nr:hypothetical protein [Bacteroidota bacterium]
MKHHILLLSIFLLSCSLSKNTSEEIKESIPEAEHESLAIDTVFLNEENSGRKEQTNNDGPELVNSDCIFNDDYKSLTSEWLEDLSISDYIWKDELNGALIPNEKDTIFISKGGCNHFGYLVELRMYNDNLSLADSSTIISRASEIANRYRMDHYSNMIQEGRLIRIKNEGSSIWYEIPDNDVNDNVYYNGIEFRVDGLIKVISISKYIN